MGNNREMFEEEFGPIVKYYLHVRLTRSVFDLQSLVVITNGKALVAENLYASNHTPGSRNLLNLALVKLDRIHVDVGHVEESVQKMSGNPSEIKEAVRNFIGSPSKLIIIPNDAPLHDNIRILDNLGITPENYPIKPDPKIHHAGFNINKQMWEVFSDQWKKYFPSQGTEMDVILTGWANDLGWDDPKVRHLLISPSVHTVNTGLWEEFNSGPVHVHGTPHKRRMDVMYKFINPFKMPRQEYFPEPDVDLFDKMSAVDSTNAVLEHSDNLTIGELKNLRVTIL